LFNKAPLTLSIGIIVLAALMPLIAPFCEHLFAEIFHLLTDIVSEIPAKGQPLFLNGHPKDIPNMENIFSG
ncbi:hypothetical protein BS416_16705, partial [Cronobacter sakazakii]